MSPSMNASLAALIVTTAVVVPAHLLMPAARAQHSMPMPASAPSGPVPAPIHTTMQALHASGGVPPGWKFLLPPGNAADGRKVFVSGSCYKCHTIKGEQFPEAAKTDADVGPDLTGMGSHHPAAYFAESIINPNRVIVDGPGYTGPDRRSRMPDYADSLTVRQLVDLVAYLKSLGDGDGMTMTDHHGH